MHALVFIRYSLSLLSQIPWRSRMRLITCFRGEDDEFTGLWTVQPPRSVWDILQGHYDPEFRSYLALLRPYAVNAVICMPQHIVAYS